MTSDLETPPGHCCLAITVWVVCTSEGFAQLQAARPAAGRGSRQLAMKSLVFRGFNCDAFSDAVKPPRGRLDTGRGQNVAKGGGGVGGSFKTAINHHISRLAVGGKRKHDAKHTKKSRFKVSEQQMEERKPPIFPSLYSYPG